MDFVKREDQNPGDEDHYKAYLDSLQKHQLETEYQHTPISMEQLHQAMQSSLSANSLHNFQLPLSPRQMSTLMLKTNHLSRNLTFNEIPAHLSRNLANISQEIDLVQNLNMTHDHGIRHEDLLGQNLMIARNLSQDLELQNNLSQIVQNQNLSEQELNRNLNSDLARNLSNELRDILPQNLRLDLPHNLSHDLNLSILNRQNINHELIDESRRHLMQVNQIIEQDISQRLNQNMSQNQHIEQNITQNQQRIVQNQRIEQNITQNQQRIVQNQRIDQNITQNQQRIVQNVTQHQQNVQTHRMTQNTSETLNPNETLVQNVNLHDLPMPFHIKSEQEDEYFYENINQGIDVNGLNGHIQPQSDQANIQDNQLYVYTTHGPNPTNVPALNPIDLYTRPNYVQNYTTKDNVQNYTIKDNPQNLVVQKQFENYTEEFKKYRQDGGIQNGGKEKEQPKENLKPNDQNKIFYNEFNQPYIQNDKNIENVTSDEKLTISEDLSMIKGEYLCYKCNQIFPSKRGLKTHAKICSGNEETVEKIGKFSCTQCTYRCQSPAILKIHERTHTGEKPFSCTFCDYKSGQKNNVAKHILTHMKEKPFRCQYCEYRCAQKNNLVVHERTHTGYKPFACSYCDYRTVQKPNLVKHMYLHTDQKPFACDQCSYRCVQKTNLTKHKLRHLNEKDGEKVDRYPKNQAKPYRPRQKSVTCSFCTYKCVQKSSLERHMQFKHPGQTITEFVEANLGENSTPINDENTYWEIQNLSVKKDVFESQQIDKEVEAQT